MGYKDVYQASADDPESFWMQAAESIDWVTPPSKALNDSNAPLYEWFTDCKVNTCWNALDRHVDAGHGDQIAIIYDSPITGAKKKITFSETRDRVAMLAGALSARGVTKGDRVIIYMSMVPEALMAMLACARLG
ncbi:MAG: acetyl-coenzyme A synthetase N-terminal domain-containing protein, partial [Pseudomonadota bacterium]